MCYPFACDGHPDTEVPRPPVKCPRHNLEHDPGEPCLQCLRAAHPAIHHRRSFDSSRHADCDVALMI